MTNYIKNNFWFYDYQNSSLKEVFQNKTNMLQKGIKVRKTLNTKHSKGREFMKNENTVVFFLNMLKKKNSVKNIGTYVHGFNRDNTVFCLYNQE